MKSVAKRIRISPAALVDALKNKPVDSATVEAMCRWMKLPPLNVITSEVEPNLKDFDKYMRQAPELIMVFREAARAAKEGEMTEDEFRELVKYTVSLIKEREAEER